MAEAEKPRTRGVRVGEIAGARYLSYLQEEGIAPDTSVETLVSEEYDIVVDSAALSVGEALQHLFGDRVKVEALPHPKEYSATARVLVRSKNGYWVIVYEEDKFMHDTISPREVVRFAEAAAREVSKALPVLERC